MACSAVKRVLGFTSRRLWSKSLAEAERFCAQRGKRKMNFFRAADVGIIKNLIDNNNKLTFNTCFVCDSGRVVVKRQTSTEKNKDDAAKRPYIHGLVVGVSLQHFWGQVALGSQKRPCDLFIHHLGEPKVNQLDFCSGTRRSQEQILRLQICGIYIVLLIEV